MTGIVYFAVASRNNDRTVAGKSFAWRLLGMMPSLSKAATVLQPDEWRTDRRTRLYHSCIDILAAQINDLIGRDMHFRFGDHKYRRSRVWMGTRCQQQRCVPQCSAQVAGVLSSSCLIQTLYIRLETLKKLGKELPKNARSCCRGMDSSAIAAKRSYVDL